MENRKEDVINKIIDNLSRRANTLFRNKNIERNLKHLELIGCNKEQLKER